MLLAVGNKNPVTVSINCCITLFSLTCHCVQRVGRQKIPQELQYINIIQYLPLLKGDAKRRIHICAWSANAQTSVVINNDLFIRL